MGGAAALTMGRKGERSWPIGLIHACFFLILCQICVFKRGSVSRFVLFCEGTQFLFWHSIKSLSGGPDLSVNLKAQVCIFSQKRGKFKI
jgi:hypothetical protein